MGVALAAVAACWTGGPDVAPTSDAGAPTPSFTAAPREEPFPASAPPVCPAPETCGAAESDAGGSLDAGALRRLYEAPPNVELREVRRSVVVGFDREAHHFVAHAVTGERGDVTVVPLDPRFDRVRPSGATGDSVLACAGPVCEVRSLPPGASAPLPVPTEMAVTVADGSCVAGTGIACWETVGTRTEWTTMLPAGTFPRPVDDFVHLGRFVFVVLVDGRVKVAYDGKVRDIDVGTSERVRGLAAEGDRSWAAVTESRRVVLGYLDRGTTCEMRGQAIAIGLGGTLYVVEGQAVHAAALTPRPFCSSEGAAPADPVLGLGVSVCNFTRNPFSVTARGIYGWTFGCSYPPG